MWQQNKTIKTSLTKDCLPIDGKGSACLYSLFTLLWLVQKILFWQLPKDIITITINNSDTDPHTITKI